MNKAFNLDDPTEVSDFIKTFGTLKGIALAHRLGISGKGAKVRANSLSNYAWNKHTAIDLRLQGKIETARTYEAICDRIYAEMHPSVKTW